MKKVLNRPGSIPRKRSELSPPMVAPNPLRRERIKISDATSAAHTTAPAYTADGNQATPASIQDAPPRNASLLALLDQWAEEDKGYDSEVWPGIEHAIKTSRVIIGDQE